MEARIQWEKARSPQVEGGPPHFVQGMYAELIVE